MIRIRMFAPLILALLSHHRAAAQEAGCRRVVLAMGTRLSIQAEPALKDGSAAATEAALEECSRIEAACSTWKPGSVFSRLNGAGGHPVQLDREWLDLLSRARAWSHLTEGAFDPALFRLLAAYGVREGGRAPSEAELAGARAASGAEHLHLDFRKASAQLDQGAGVEEGGFVKGYALDRMRDQLARSGVHDACLDFGGQLLAFGKPVVVSVADPNDRSLPRLSLQLVNASLASSGLSEHGRHIVDPRSGSLCEDWGSVAAAAASGFDADCLSTALYVMGPDQGLAWCERHHIAAVFLLKDGRIRMSPAFAAMNPLTLPPEKS